MEDNKMVEYKGNLFNKIKNFFLRLFKKSSNSLETQPRDFKNQSNLEEHLFRDNIIVKQDKEELRILQLQREYKSGKILEEDMSQEDKEKLINLYKKQNLELKETIKNEKEEIRKMLDELKAS